MASRTPTFKRALSHPNEKIRKLPTLSVEQPGQVLRVARHRAVLLLKRSPATTSALPIRPNLSTSLPRAAKSSTSSVSPALIYFVPRRRNHFGIHHIDAQTFLKKVYTLMVSERNFFSQVLMSSTSRSAFHSAPSQVGVLLKLSTADRQFRKTFPPWANSCASRPVCRAPILPGMPRHIHNWTYRDVTQFLKEHGFEYYKPHRGSHELWKKHGQDGAPDWILEVNFAHTSYKVKTLKTMIKQSGIPQDVWTAWANA